MMNRRETKTILAALLSLVFSFLMGGSLAAQERINFGTAPRGHAFYDLPFLAADEKGIWKQNHLDVQWVPFRATPDLHRGVASGSIDMGLTGAVSAIQAVARGVPLVIVANAGGQTDFFLWVKASSPLKEPGQLKGARIGVARLGGVDHAYGQVAVKALALEKNVKFVALGGTRERMGALKSGSVEAAAAAFTSTAPLKYSGDVRELVDISQYLRQPMVERIAYARKEVAERKPELITRGLKAVFQTFDFIRNNRTWAVEKMKSFLHYDEATAQAVFDILYYSKEATVERKALENVRAFLIEYALIDKQKAPSIEALYQRFSP